MHEAADLDVVPNRRDVHLESIRPRLGAGEAARIPLLQDLGEQFFAATEVVQDVGGLEAELWLDIDDTRRQTGSTSTMIFSPTFIVHYLSQFLALEPGDLINTGTPPGVGMGLSPQVFIPFPVAAA